MYSEYVNIDFFVRMHVAKEATQSTKIEGTQTNIEEAFLKREEIETERRDGWEETRNYISAMNEGINLLQYKKIFEAKKRPKIEITTENQLLLEAFKNEKYITNYEEDSKKQKFYKITKHKPNKKIPIELL